MKNISNSEANTALVQSMYAAFGRGDFAAVAGFCAPDVEWEVIGPGRKLPILGVRRGAVEVEKYFRLAHEIYTFTEFSLENFLAGGDTVVALGRYSFKFNHNGRSVATQFAHAFTLRDGKVARCCGFVDSAQFVEAYGAAHADGALAAERNKATIRRWVEDGWNKRNLALVDEIFAADVRQHDANSPPVTNAEELKGYIGSLMTALPDLNFTIAGLAADGDRVVWRFESRGTHRAPLMGIAATGRAATVGGQAEFRFAGDRVAEVWVNYDLFGMLRQLGAIPAQP